LSLIEDSEQAFVERPKVHL